MAEDSVAQKTQRAKPARRNRFVDVLLRLLKEKPLGAFGAVIVIVLFLTGIFANQIAPYGVNATDLYARLMPPSGTHLLGTDNLGRDMFSRIIFGAQISMYVGLGCAFFGVGIATILGTLSGFLGGKVDVVIQRCVDAWMCFPPLFIVLTVMAVVGPGLGQVIFVLSLVYGITYSRVVRSGVITVKQNAYIEAARSIGTGTFQTLIKHILPNIMAIIIVMFTMNMGTSILTEATISFLGFGVPPPAPSWGGMLSGPARQYMLQAPWMALWPGAALAIVVYGINMLGDALRDLMDPKLRGGLGRYGSSKQKKLSERMKEAANS